DGFNLTLFNSVNRLGDLADNTDNAVGKGKQLADATDKNTKATDRSAKSTDNANKSIEKTGEKAVSTSDAIKALTSAFDRLNGRTLDVLDAEIAWQDSLVNL